MKTGITLLLIVLACGTLTARERAAEPDGRRIGLTITGLIDGSDRIVIDREGARWENVHWGLGRSQLRLNGVHWNPRESLRLANQGTTTFLPVPVDFSTARIEGGRRGRDAVALFPGKDSVAIRIADNPNGADVYTFTVTFEPASRQAALFLRGTIDGSEEVRIDADGATWTHRHWGWPRGPVFLNGTAWQPRERSRLANAGRTRFLPDGVDFRTARVVHRSGRDLVAVEAAHDHLIVRITDTPGGAGVYEVLIRFGPEE